MHADNALVRKLFSAKWTLSSFDKSMKNSCCAESWCCLQFSQYSEFGISQSSMRFVLEVSKSYTLHIAGNPDRVWLARRSRCGAGSFLFHNWWICQFLVWRKCGAHKLHYTWWSWGLWRFCGLVRKCSLLSYQWLQLVCASSNFPTHIFVYGVYSNL